MPCLRRLVKDAGQRFEFQITGDTNLLTASGALTDSSATVAEMRQRTFTLAQLRAGISWTLVSGQVYVLTIVSVPENPAQDTTIDTRVSFDGVASTRTCTRKGAGIIGTWIITVP